MMGQDDDPWNDEIDERTENDRLWKNAAESWKEVGYREGVLEENEEPDQAVQNAFDIGYKLACELSAKLCKQLATLELIQKHLGMKKTANGWEKIELLISEWKGVVAAVKGLPEQLETDQSVFDGDKAMFEWYHAKVSEIFDYDELQRKTCDFQSID